MEPWTKTPLKVSSGSLCKGPLSSGPLGVYTLLETLADTCNRVLVFEFFLDAFHLAFTLPTVGFWPFVESLSLLESLCISTTI